MTLASLAVRNLGRNKFRTVSTAAGVAVTVLAFLLLRTVIGAWTMSGQWAAKDRIATRNKVTFVMALPKRYVEDLRRGPHVRAATWASWFGGKDPKHEHEFFATLAVDHETYCEVYDDMKVAADELDAWKRDRHGAIVGDLLARKMNWKVGDEVTLESGIFPGDWPLRLQGVYTASARSVDRSTLLLHWDYLNESLPPSARDQVGWIVSRVDDPSHVAEISAGIDKQFDDREIPTLSQDEGSFSTSMLAMYSAVLSAMNVASLGVLVIMTLILGNAIAMAVTERTSEYGVLRAVGFSPSHLASWIVGESVVTGLLGGATGLAIAWPLINVGLGRFVAENMGSMFRYFRLAVPDAALGLLLAMALGGVAAAIPAWRISQLGLVESVRRSL